MVLSGGDAPQEIQYAAGSASLFRALRVQPAAGRVFLDQEDQPDGERVVLVSNALWRTRFGADPGLVGASRFDGQSYQVVGVRRISP
jgi:hypothetical protein